jgi:hypothetical protein
MANSQKDDQFSDEEAERRMIEAMRRALNMPPHPRPTGRRKAEKAGEDRSPPKRDGDAGA